MLVLCTFQNVICKLTQRTFCCSEQIAVIIIIQRIQILRIQIQIDILVHKLNHRFWFHGILYILAGIVVVKISVRIILLFGSIICLDGDSYFQILQILKPAGLQMNAFGCIAFDIWYIGSFIYGNINTVLMILKIYCRIISLCYIRFRNSGCCGRTKSSR